MAVALASVAAASGVAASSAARSVAWRTLAGAVDPGRSAAGVATWRVATGAHFPFSPASGTRGAASSSGGGGGGDGSARKRFRAWVVDADKGKLKHRGIQEFGDVSELPRQDPEASVTVRVSYSDMNYKDAMIARGQHGVCKGFPIVPGIDLSGVVEESSSPLWRPGDEVVLTGNKIGQFFDGGWAELCRVQAEWLVPRPETFDLEECMIIGTAGFTAMQMVMQLEERGGMAPAAGGAVLVTGAGGGVGSIAVATLSRLGYYVVASTGRPVELEDYLRSLGAAEVIGRLADDGRPLQTQKWAQVIDTVGGPTLSTALAQTRCDGSVAAVGVAAGGVLNTTVYPFVLRGVRLLGVDSTLPWNLEGYDRDLDTWLRHRRERLAVWRRLERDLSPEALRKTHKATVPLDQAAEWAEELLCGLSPTATGRLHGRVVVRVQP